MPEENNLSENTPPEVPSTDTNGEENLAGEKPTKKRSKDTFGFKIAFVSVAFIVVLAVLLAGLSGVLGLQGNLRTQSFDSSTTTSSGDSCPVATVTATSIELGNLPLPTGDLIDLQYTIEEIGFSDTVPEEEAFLEATRDAYDKAYEKFAKDLVLQESLRTMAISKAIEFCDNQDGCMAPTDITIPPSNWDDYKTDCKYDKDEDWFYEPPQLAHIVARCYLRLKFTLQCVSDEPTPEPLLPLIQSCPLLAGNNIESHAIPIGWGKGESEYLLADEDNPIRMIAIEKKVREEAQADADNSATKSSNPKDPEEIAAEAVRIRIECDDASDDSPCMLNPEEVACEVKEPFYTAGVKRDGIYVSFSVRKMTIKNVIKMYPVECEPGCEIQETPPPHHPIDSIMGHYWPLSVQTSDDEPISDEPISEETFSEEPISEETFSEEPISEETFSEDGYMPIP